MGKGCLYCQYTKGLNGDRNKNILAYFLYLENSGLVRDASQNEYVMNTINKIETTE